MRGKLFALVLFFALVISSDSYADIFCNDCPEGEIPGEGTVTVTYNRRVFSSGSSPECALVLCSTLNLSGSAPTDGVQSYAGILVPVDGTIVTTGDTCCVALAPITTDVEGFILTAYNSLLLTAVSDISFIPVGQAGEGSNLSIGPGSASCASFTMTETEYLDSGQTIATITVSFSGGACVPVGGGGDDDNNNDDNPDNDDDNNDPDNRPDLPDPQPPIDEPDPPIDPPDDPEPDDPPVADPPTDDECCLAIVTRLDVVINQIQISNDLLGTGNDLTRNTNQISAQTNIMLAGMSNQIFDLAYRITDEEVGLLPYIADRLQDSQILLGDIEDYSGAMLSVQKDIRDAIGGDVVDPGTPAPPGSIDYGSPLVPMGAVEATHRATMLEYNQVFGLPDIPEFLTDDAPVWDWDIQLPMTDEVFTLNVDFSPMTPIRDVVHFAIMLLASVHSVLIIVRVIKK